MANSTNTISRSWLITQAKKHQSKLLFANVIAIVATLISVPIPLLMPLMVDEVLLNQPSTGIEMMNRDSSRLSLKPLPIRCAAR